MISLRTFFISVTSVRISDNNSLVHINLRISTILCKFFCSRIVKIPRHFQAISTFFHYYFHNVHHGFYHPRHHLPAIYGPYHISRINMLISIHNFKHDCRRWSRQTNQSVVGLVSPNSPTTFNIWVQTIKKTALINLEKNKLRPKEEKKCTYKICN